MNAKLTAILAETFSMPASEISLQTSKRDVANWDSLKQMDLVMTLEQRFEVTLEIEDIVSMTSVERIVSVLKAKGIHVEN